MEEQEEEEVPEPRFVCRFCNKACFNGKSLGGHMRCHLDLIAAAKKQNQPSQETAKNSGNQSLKCCRKCGKWFPSVKALAGHLKCHSRKVFGSEETHLCEKCGKGFDSIRALYGHMKIHSKRSRASEDEEEQKTICPVRKKRSTIRYKLTTHATPRVSEIQESNNSVASECDEAQDAAMCLVMLSRGMTSWNEFVSETTQSVFCKEEIWDTADEGETPISWKNLSEICSFGCGTGNQESCFDPEAKIAVHESARIKDHVCPVCCKVFQSGQALGGHKRAHYNNIEIKVKKENLSEILDLNLPVDSAAATF